MDYYIRTQSAGTPNAVVPLTDEVCRLGSSKQCQILIPTRSPHALTVFRQRGLLFVLNRTMQTVRLGGDSLAAGETVEWRTGKTLVVDGVSLKLAVNRALPAKSADAITESLGTTQTLPRIDGGRGTPAEKNKTKSKQTSQIVTIICCALVIGFMYWCGQGVDSNGERENEQLTLLTEPFRSMSSDSNINKDEAIRSRTLLGMIAQYRLAMILGEPQNAELARDDTRTFCRSISQASTIGHRELIAVKKLGDWFEKRD